MKSEKHISLFLAFFLLVSNVGFSIDTHYCGGKIASINPVFWKTTKSIAENECCPPKTSEISKEKKSCCKDKVVHLQKKSENTTVKSLYFQLSSTVLTEEWNPIVFPEISIFESNPINSYYCDANAPPLFKLYHQYLFYA